MNDVPKIDPLVSNLLDAADSLKKAHYFSEEAKYDSSVWYRINELSFHLSNLIHSFTHVN